MLLFKDILPFLGLDYRDASLIKLYLVVIVIYQKLDESDNFNIQKFVVKKVKNQHVTIIELLRLQSRT